MKNAKTSRLLAFNNTVCISEPTSSLASIIRYSDSELEMFQLEAYTSYPVGSRLKERNRREEIFTNNAHTSRDLMGP